MAEHRHTQKSTPRRSSEPTVATDAQVPVDDAGERLRDEIDSLLEEIDDVLETNAEEFVKNYVQKGGQ